MKKVSFILGALVSVSGCTTDDLNADDVELSTSSSELGLRWLPNNLPIVNTLGFSETFSTEGRVELRNEFFDEFGTNDRTCGSCHKVTEGWTISAAHTRLLFELTRGRDPLFRTNDGTNSPNADVSTLSARRSAYSMLLSRGTIRVGIGMPANANFELVSVDDPYNFASAAELSMFRRPLPAANLTAIPTVMWDGRVTGATINDALKDQANGATQGHAAAPNPLNDVTRQQIVDFETGLFNAQAYTWGIGFLDANGAGGRAETLAAQNVEFTTVIPTRDARRWNLFDSWQNSTDPDRRAVYRGQELFNTRPHVNDANGNPRPEFTCTNCHTVQNFGTDLAGRFFNIIDTPTVALRRSPDQPLYTFRYTGPPITNAGGVVTTPTGATIQITDPGRALITGQWRDMGRFKVPSIRGLAARAPYFHDGSANTLLDIVKAYETFQGFVFTPEEEADLVAFLSAL